VERLPRSDGGGGVGQQRSWPRNARATAAVESRKFETVDGSDRGRAARDGSRLPSRSAAAEAAAGRRRRSRRAWVRPAAVAVKPRLIRWTGKLPNHQNACTARGPASTRRWPTPPSRRDTHGARSRCAASVPNQRNLVQSRCRGRPNPSIQGQGGQGSAGGVTLSA